MSSISNLTRRSWFASAAALPAAAVAAVVGRGSAQDVRGVPGLPPRLKTSCNLYSFNGPLTRGEMSLEEVIEYCAAAGFDAIDPTGYYFKGYPDAPPDPLVYRIKRLAFSLGLDISGTGVRNDFAVPDQSKRDADVALVGRWIPVAAKLGAPVLRVFDGRAMPAGYPRATVMDWIVGGLQQCVSMGEAGGVMIVLQNHNDALKTADDYLEIRSRIHSPWFGLNVDIGSLRTTDDPYAEIARLAPYARTWQVKELVYRRDKAERADLARIVRILRDARYRGYVPLETLGDGDPKLKIGRFLEEFRTALV